MVGRLGYPYVLHSDPIEVIRPIKYFLFVFVQYS